MKTHDSPSHPAFHHADDGQPNDLMAKPYSIILTAVFLFILILGIALFLGWRHFETTRHNALANDKTTANFLADLILAQNKATTGILQSYAHRPLFIDAVKNKDLAGVHRHLSDLKKNADIDLTFVTDTRGILWANFPLLPEAIGKDLSYRDWYKGISTNWKPYISNVFKLIVGDKPLAVAICVPIIDEKERPVGILATSQRLSFLANALQRAPLSPYTTVNVIDRTGHIIYSNAVAYSEKPTFYRLFPIVEAALKGKKQQIEMNDPPQVQGKSYFTVVSVGNIGWSVTIERTRGDIFRSDIRSFIETGAISFLLFILIVFLLVYLRNISLSKKTAALLEAETKLRQGEEEMRALSSRQEAILAAVPEIIMEVDNNKVYTWANSVGIEFFGEDVIGKEASFYFEGEQDTYYTVYPLFSGTEDTIYLESWQRRRDGQKRLLAWWCRVLNDKEGNVSGALSSAYDITERKQAEEALRESEKKYRDLFENALEGIYQATPEGRFVSANPAIARMFGYDSADELIAGVNDIKSQIYINPEDRTELLRRIAANGFLSSYELQYRRKDGSAIWLSLNIRAVKDETGKLVCLEGTAVDITERKRAEEEILKLNEELEQRVTERTVRLEGANKEIEAFSYSVSHDLRAPLRSIDGFSQALLEEYQEKLDETGKNYLERVRKAAQRMGWLIDDLLKLSRVGRSELQCEAVDLSDMVRAILQTTQQNSPDRTVDITVQDGIIAQGDHYMLQIALRNLLDNAWKFTGKEARPRIEFGSAVKDGKTLYYVRDNGAGFDMAYVDKLFGAFQRLHTTEEFAGTGIGLATVQRIISRHGGRVWAEGETGKGATFYFTLPS
ncbi:MAG: PAS domain S-box protein [Syntrophales bacterium]